MSLIESIESVQADGLARLIEWCGTQGNLAKLLDVTPQTVANWVKRGRISATAAIEAEVQTRGEFTRSDLRPDVREWRILVADDTEQETSEW